MPRCCRPALYVYEGEQQLLDMGLTVLRNTRDFEMGLGDWELKPVGEKTWEGFKTHFTRHKSNLKPFEDPQCNKRDTIMPIIWLNKCAQTSIHATQK